METVNDNKFSVRKFMNCKSVILVLVLWLVFKSFKLRLARFFRGNPRYIRYMVVNDRNPTARYLQNVYLVVFESLSNFKWAGPAISLLSEHDEMVDLDPDFS